MSRLSPMRPPHSSRARSHTCRPIASRHRQAGRLLQLGAVAFATTLSSGAMAVDAEAPAWRPGQTIPQAPPMTSLMREAVRPSPAKVAPNAWKAKPRTFEDLLATTEPSPDLASLVGALLPERCPPDAGALDSADCGAGDESASGSLLGKVFRITSADPAAVDVSDFNLRLMGETVAVKGCLACSAPVVVPSSKLRRYVTLRKPDGRSSSVADGLPAVASRTMKFGSIPLAMDWLDGTAPLLRAEIVFRATPTPWTVGEGEGIALEGLGLRVYNVCTGDVILSTPPSSGYRVDSLLEVDACRAAAARVAAARAEDEAAPPQVPVRLTTRQIERAMKALRPKVKACYAKYHVPGSVLVKYVIKDGMMESVRMQGTLRGTPSGDCALAAVRSVAFAGTKASGSFAYPFMLRGP